MPLYEYACKSCDHHFDVRHSADEVPALSCPICASEVKKVFHAAGIIFKGSGWYITDNAAKSSVTTEPKSEVKPEVKSETKTDTSEKPATESPSPAPSAN